VCSHCDGGLWTAAYLYRKISLLLQSGLPPFLHQRNLVHQHKVVSNRGWNHGMPFPGAWALALRSLLRSLLPIFLHTMTFPGSASAWGAPCFQSEISGASGVRHARNLESVCCKGDPSPIPAAASLLRGGDSGNAAPSSVLPRLVPLGAFSTVGGRGFGLAQRLMRPFGSLARVCSRGWQFVLRMVGCESEAVGFANLPSVVSWNHRPEFMQVPAPKSRPCECSACLNPAPQNQ
jgi:hypothetical protein